MSIKDCRTCEFLVDGVCQNYEGIHGRGWRPVHTDREKTCWSVSMDHFVELVSRLPEQEMRWFRTRENITVDDLIHRVNLGYWRNKVLKERRTACQGSESHRTIDMAAFL